MIGFLITVGSVLYAVWTRFKTQTQVQELTRAMESIHDLSSTALWEVHTSPAEDEAARLRHFERQLGLVQGIRNLSGKYAYTTQTPNPGELGSLLERGLVWSTAMLWNIELSTNLTEVWILTADLKPDASDVTTGNLVRNNLRSGKRYIYFIPDDMADMERLRERLYANIGADKTRPGRELRLRVQVVPVPHAVVEHYASRGNICIYYHGEVSTSQAYCFEELHFSRLAERGMFWQQREGVEIDMLRRILQEALGKTVT